MLRIVFAVVMLIHGLIHLLGFVKEWNLMEVSQLSGKTLITLNGNLPKVAGVLWLLVALCFSIAAVGFLMKGEWWWMLAVAAIALSQILIIVYWKDAWAGTIANVIILPVVIVSFGDWNFDRTVRNEVKTLFAGSANDSRAIVTTEMLKVLPGCVQKWIERSNVVGKERIQTVRLKQTGEMRTTPEGSWMSAEAEQYFTVDRPAFVWKAKVDAAPLVHLSGRDMYKDGKGNMLIKLLSLVPVANSKGKEIDQGTMLRYLAETAWFPTACLSEYIKWEEIDSTSAHATMSHDGVTASGVFSFNNAGDVVNFQAQRYGEFDGKYSLETWSISMKDHKSFAGVRIPYLTEATWKLQTGDFTWFKLEITDLQYNTPEMY